MYSYVSVGWARIGAGTKSERKENDEELIHRNLVSRTMSWISSRLFPLLYILIIIWSTSIWLLNAWCVYFFIAVAVTFCSSFFCSWSTAYFSILTSSDDDAYVHSRHMNAPRTDASADIGSSALCYELLQQVDFVEYGLSLLLSRTHRRPAQIDALRARRHIVTFSLSRQHST